MQRIELLCPGKSTEGLWSYEISALVSIMENRLTPDAQVTPRDVQEDMRKAGYTAIAISLSLEGLNRKGLIEFDDHEADNFRKTYTVILLTPQCLDCLLLNNNPFTIVRYT